jgi:hypothetical protein
MKAAPHSPHFVRPENKYFGRRNWLKRLPTRPSSIALNARVSRLYRLPDFIVDDPHLRHVLRDPLRQRIRPGDTLAAIWILQEPLPR